MSHVSRIADALERSEQLAEFEAARADMEAAETERQRTRRRWRGAPAGMKNDRLKDYQHATAAALDAGKKVYALLRELKR